MIKIKRIERIVSFILSLFLTLSIYTTSFAMDKDYIDNNSKWHESNITTSILSYPNGYYQYFLDKSENSFYFHISYSLQNLSKNSKISVSFSSSNNSNFYNIIFDKNTIIDSTGNIENSFKLLSSFSDVVGSGQDIYFGIEFLDKEDIKLQNNISVSIRVNSDVYYITDDIILKFNNQNNSLQGSINKNDSTTNKSNNNNSNSANKENKDNTKTTKFHYNGENNNNYNNTPDRVQDNNQNNNKYKYDYNSSNIYENDENNVGDSSFFYDNNGNMIIPEKETKSKLSPIAKILIIISVLLCTSGIGLITHYIIKSKSKKDKCNNTNTNNNADTDKQN